MSNLIFKNGGGAGIGSYVIVFNNQQLAPGTDLIALRKAYEAGESIYFSLIDPQTRDALISASGWIDEENCLHLIARDFDDNRTYIVVLSETPETGAAVDVEVLDYIDMGGEPLPTQEEIEEALETKANLVDGKIPADELPSYVDDVVEYASFNDFPEEGEQGKIYVDLSTNSTYRWSGTQYIQIGGQDFSNYYTKAETDELLDEKADDDSVVKLAGQQLIQGRKNFGDGIGVAGATIEDNQIAFDDGEGDYNYLYYKSRNDIPAFNKLDVQDDFILFDYSVPHYPSGGGEFALTIDQDEGCLAWKEAVTMSVEQIRRPYNVGYFVFPWGMRSDLLAISTLSELNEIYGTDIPSDPSGRPGSYTLLAYVSDGERVPVPGVVSYMAKLEVLSLTVVANDVFWAGSKVLKLGKIYVLSDAEDSLEMMMVKTERSDSSNDAIHGVSVTPMVSMVDSYTKDQIDSKLAAKADDDAVLKLVGGGTVVPASSEGYQTSISGNQISIAKTPLGADSLTLTSSSVVYNNPSSSRYFTIDDSGFTVKNGKYTTSGYRYGDDGIHKISYGSETNLYSFPDKAGTIALAEDYYTKSEDDALLAVKQAVLVSGTNIKTVNGQSLLGSGDLDVSTDLSDYYDKDAVDSLLEGKQDTLVSGTNVKTINGESVLGEGNISISSELAVAILYADLVSLRSAGQLIPGMRYRITDYQCTTTTANTFSAGHQFDIIVTALSNNTLDEEAEAALHEGDTYFANNNLGAWRLWYCLDNDTKKFNWADATNGKGVIYRMIDEFRNDVPYDFKNIQYTKVNKFVKAYTFNIVKNGANTDGSIDKNAYCYRNVIKAYTSRDGLMMQFLNQTIINAETRSMMYCYRNYIGPDNRDNTIYGFFGYNQIGSGFVNNEIGDMFNSNIISDNFNNNIIGKHFNGCVVNFGFGHNNIGSSPTDNVYAYNCVFEQGISYINLTTPGLYPTSGNLMQNIRIHSGVKGNSSTVKEVKVPKRNQAYWLGAYQDTNGVVTFFKDDQVVTPPTNALSGQVLVADGEGGASWQVPADTGVTSLGGATGAVLLDNGLSMSDNTLSVSGVKYLTTAPTADNVSGSLSFVVLTSEPATRYNGYLYIIVEAPASGYSGNITASEQSGGGNGQETYIKFDSAPTSQNDYDFYCTLTGSILDSNGSIAVSPTYANKTKVYVWTERSGGIIINGVTTSAIPFGSGDGYQNAVEVILTGNYDIAMIWGASGGGSN